MRNLTLLLSLLSVQLTVRAQGAVTNFKAEEINENVYLTWTIKQGFTCNGVEVLRSTDSVNFVKVGDIEGICGSTAEEIHYDFTDIFPEKNADNFYRLSLGGLGFSSIISIRVVDLPANKYLVVPNPLTENTQIFFENSAFAICSLTVYDPGGQPLYQAMTTGEAFSLQKENFPDGVYFFRISYDNSKEDLVGRFVAY